MRCCLKTASRHDIKTILSRPPDFETEERDAQFWMPQQFGEGSLWIGKFTGQSPWERHTTTDELLHILEGEVEVTVLTEDERHSTTLRAGSLFVVPKGCWHRLYAADQVTSCGVTPGPTEHTQAEDPRNEE